MVSAAHGGLIASLTDTLGSLAVASKGQYMTGVSTDIGTSYVRPAGRAGDVLHAKAILTGIGEYDFSRPMCVSHTDLFYAIQENPLPLLGSISQILRGIWSHMGVSLLQRQALVYIILVFHFTDHTKYIGKSSAHPVSFNCFLGFHHFSLTFSNKKNVKFSDDGAHVIEGENVD